MLPLVCDGSWCCSEEADFHGVRAERVRPGQSHVLGIEQTVRQQNGSGDRRTRQGSWRLGPFHQQAVRFVVADEAGHHDGNLPAHETVSGKGGSRTTQLAILHTRSLRDHHELVLGRHGPHQRHVAIPFPNATPQLDWVIRRPECRTLDVGGLLGADELNCGVGRGLGAQGPFINFQDTLMGVTGGTGFFAEARGVVRLHPITPFKFMYTFTLTGIPKLPEVLTKELVVPGFGVEAHADAVQGKPESTLANFTN
uniref:allene-oxide cyclase n=1 Tax=Physcomitrium patens TaxID=3218 RepID=A0A2K1L2V5_PHYPA|nr:hypothetical protein PHYPA_003149 [Physcomitrium patens]